MKKRYFYFDGFLKQVPPLKYFMAIFYEMKLEEGGVKENSRKGVIGKKKFIQTTTILCLSKHHCQVGRRGEERRGGGVRVLTTKLWHLSSW
jgi:hypothetical protein